MKNATCLLIALSSLLLPLISAAQNLVTNPGFEQYTNCPSDRANVNFTANYDSFETVDYWENPVLNTSPDYFNTCATNPLVTVPTNLYDGYQEPHGGNGYAGIALFSGNVDNDSLDDWREYLETKLAQPLIAGHDYYLSLFVNQTMHRTEVYDIISVDKIGMQLRDNVFDTLFTSGHRFFVSGPGTIVTTPNTFITDTVNWTKIHGIYHAHGGEQWLIIGYFYDTSFINYTSIYSQSAIRRTSICYMNIDDACVLDMINPATTDTTLLVATYPQILYPHAVHSEYLWNTGDTTPSITIHKPGTYWRNAWDDCSYYSDTLKVVEENIDNCLWMPNAFTPNGDGRNDLFGPEYKCSANFVVYTFSVFNRWGEKIFGTDVPGVKWDGTLNGTPQDGGIYFYQLLYSTHFTGSHPGATKLNDKSVNVLKGNVTLIR